VAASLLRSPELAARTTVWEVYRADVLGAPELLDTIANGEVDEPFIVYVRPSRQLMGLWQNRQEDNIDMKHEKKAIEPKPRNQADHLEKVCNKLEAALRTRRAGSYLAYALAPDEKALHDASARAYEPPELSDWALRIAWNIATTILGGVDEARALLKPDSILGRFGEELADDSECDGSHLRRLRFE
jgi:hypothetical protein